MSQTSWRSIADLVLAARERPAADRETFIRSRCPDPQLQESIAALIGDAVKSADRPGVPDLELDTGARVGPYVVLRRLGRGGMGEVFLATDTRLDRAVALKGLTCGTSEHPAVHDLVVREARAAARINHPHVATVHDVVDDGTRAFIVMEYVEGESLAAMLRMGALPAGRVVEIGRQLASALTAAHRAGIIHRDLKPGNVQVMPDGGVKILDFGIAVASAVAASATTRTDLSVYPRHAALRAGTPGYMSPEQMVGLPADERSDVFSVGVVLFEAATGRKPVEPGEPLDLLVTMIHGLPRADAVSTRVPEDLADVIAKSLAADPRQRFQSAGELRLALDEVGNVRSAAEPAGPRLRHMLAAAVGATLTVWLLGALSSLAYNVTLARSGAFAAETPLAHLGWGLRSLVAPFVQTALALIVLWSARFVLRLVALWPPAARRLMNVHRRLRDAAERIGLNDPLVLAQALTACGIGAIALFAWRFNALIRAWGANISSARVVNLAPLSPGNEDEKVLYRAALTILLFLMAAGLYRVLRLRRGTHARRGRGAVIALCAVLVVILLLAELPYRILWKNAAPRATLAGERCYAIGDNGRDYLLYCPAASPPRNRIVAKTDPSLQMSGVSESIFTPAGQQEGR